MRKSKLKLNENVVNKEGRVFCMCCGDVKKYTVREIRLGTIRIAICDECLLELQNDIKDYLDEKLLTYALGYNDVGEFGLDKSVITILLDNNKVVTEEEVSNVLEKYKASL